MRVCSISVLGVAVDVEVGDAEPGGLAAIEAEPREHDARVQQPGVLERLEIAGDVGSGQRRELELALGRRRDVHRGPRGLDVAGDERRLALFLVGADDRSLHDRREGDAAEDRDDEPQRRGHQRHAPPVGADRPEVQPGREQRDQHQQHQGRDLSVDDRVRGALHEAARLVGELVPRHPVVARLDGGEQREQRRHVHTGGGSHRGRRRREQHAAVQQVGGHREQQHDDSAANSQSIVNARNGSSKT
jgi:hypothetical protein